MQKKATVLLLLILCWFFTPAQKAPAVSISTVAPGWAGNSINAVVFRKNSLASFRDTQFIAFYDHEGFVNLGKRSLKRGPWTLLKTAYKGNIRDAHNSISIAVDGDGFLHIAWDHHNSMLRYCKSVLPLSLELTAPTAMTGTAELKVSYPEFYLQPSGDLLFFYRDGGSGNGNLVINAYKTKAKSWSRIQSNLIDGEGKRNAYWQACVDSRGAIHLSWVWRESPDVASNHDVSYAVSRDGGISWLKSTGEAYQLPINAATAEIVAVIPQKSELINQTSMCTDAAGNPIIASYWTGSGDVPQYQLIYKAANKWIVKDSRFRSSGFSLSGMGTKSIPIARPQVISWKKGRQTMVALIFRDVERGNKISLAYNKIYQDNKWKLADLQEDNMGAWEPSFDTELWRRKNELHIFAQKVTQADGERVVLAAPEAVKVLQVKF